MTISVDYTCQDHWENCSTRACKHIVLLTDKIALNLDFAKCTFLFDRAISYLYQIGNVESYTPHRTFSSVDVPFLCVAQNTPQ